LVAPRESSFSAKLRRVAHGGARLVELANTPNLGRALLQRSGTDWDKKHFRSTGYRAFSRRRETLRKLTQCSALNFVPEAKSLLRLDIFLA
jgi:hypothetical protein